MKKTTTVSRIAVLGIGAIGRRVLTSLQGSLVPDASYAAFDRPEAPSNTDAWPTVSHFSDLTDLINWHPQLAIECAGHGVVSSIVPQLLSAGVDVMVVSIGALVDEKLRQRLESASLKGGSRLLTVSGAIGGLDALDAARSAGLDAVVYTGRKPPGAWRGTPADGLFNLDSIRVPTEIFRGSAGEAVRLYPKNANVTAAVALAGIGFDQTDVCLIADPGIEQNVHELDVHGAFGRFSIRLENKPLPDNPKTSWLAALSIESALRKHLRISFNTTQPTDSP